MNDHARQWHLADRVLQLTDSPLVMGIVNVTSDSFSDGGRFLAPDAALAHAQELVGQGADILDIGGESTRPGSQPISLEEELHRVIPVVEGLAEQTRVPVSIDTSKAGVARTCLERGVHIINDVTGLRGDPALAEVLAAHNAGVIVMHMQGTPAMMQQAPHYNDVVAEISSFFEERLHAAVSAGIARERIVLDPGIGFGKTREHNLEILARLDEFQRLGRPVCLGVSRKGFLGRLLGERPTEHRLAASLAAVCYALERGAIQVVRVHDVRETCDAITVYSAFRGHIRR
jgi:dihydropteroate synthase